MKQCSPTVYALSQDCISGTNPFPSCLKILKAYKLRPERNALFVFCTVLLWGRAGAGKKIRGNKNINREIFP